MKYRAFGKTGWNASILGMGAMRLPTVDGNRMGPNILEDEAIALAPRLEAMLRQGREERAPLADSFAKALSFTIKFLKNEPAFPFFASSGNGYFVSRILITASRISAKDGTVPLNFASRSR